MRRYSILIVLALLTACGPGKLPSQKIGKPYVVNGETYYPSYESGYDKTGTASWYGPGFHGERTASGETYDQNDFTAAHPTLPMPSLVRVTNLENGKSLIVRINDRGPFKASRLIDLSKKSAQALGIHSLGKVRVQFLEQETQQYLAMVKENGGTIIPMAEYHKRAEEFAARQQQQQEPSSEEEQVAEQDDDNGVPTNTNAVSAPTMTVAEQDIGSQDIPPPASKKVVATVEKNKPAVPRLFVQEAQAEEAPQAPAQAVIIHENETITEAAPAAGDDTAATYVPEKTVTTMTGKYTIQAGAFSSEANAKKLADQLQSLGETSIDQITAGGRQLWRVRVGGFAARDYADDVLAQVRGYAPDAKVVKK